MIEFMALSVPAGLGDPVYEKLEANLAYAMMSLPATKGFEIGSGFQSVVMPGSEHNDRFTKESGNVADTNKLCWRNFRRDFHRHADYWKSCF